MGNAETKVDFRKTVMDLTSKSASGANDTTFWTQFWAQANVNSAKDVFNLTPAADIRALRDASPSNLGTLCHKAIECIVKARDSACPSSEHKKVINCIRLLTRLIPFLYEDPEWRSYFWNSALPSANGGKVDENSDAQKISIASQLIAVLSDLLFCPNFTISPSGNAPVESLASLDSCECIWQAGVGYANRPPINATHDANRTEILKLLLACFSELIYMRPNEENRLRWIMHFTSAENRHVLPLFTSLLNVVCAYDPVGYGLPYNYLLMSDTREPLVQAAVQLLIVCLDRDSQPNEEESGYATNFFVNYLSRIHREDDFDFMLKGLTRLLNNPLQSSYLPNSTKKVTFHQELLVLLWKCCEYNQKFMFYVLKTSDVLEILVPILYHINNARADSARVGLVHMGVFLILLLSGERNFGVRLNKPFTMRGVIDIPPFTGTHADLLIINASKCKKNFAHPFAHVLNWRQRVHSVVFGSKRVQNFVPTFIKLKRRRTQILDSLGSSTNRMNSLGPIQNTSKRVFHKIITSGNHRLQSLFDCLLTIIVNVSPYLKSLSMVTANKLVHLVEAFSTPWFLFSTPTNHHLLFFLLEMFNNIIQYQFDGNSNLIYTIIRKRQVFHQLSNLNADSLTSYYKKPKAKSTVESNIPSSSPPPESKSDDRATIPQVEGDNNLSIGLKSTLAKTPDITAMTGKKTESDGSHPVDAPTSRDSPTTTTDWVPTPEWMESWKKKLPLQTIIRVLQILVPQVEKICIDKGLTDESEILKFLQHGTLVGLLPVPHPILIRKYIANAATNHWFRTYMWGVIYLRNTDPAIWYDTDVNLFEIQRI